MALSVLIRNLKFKNTLERCTYMSLYKLSQLQVRHHGNFYPIDDVLFGLTEQQQLLRKTLFDFSQKELGPIADSIDKDDEFPDKRGLWRKCGDIGLLGVTVNPDYGGSGMSYLDQVLAMEEVCRVSASAGLAFGAHANLCCDNLNRNGTHEQKTKYLPKLCAGELIGALAMSEAESGSDVVSMKLKAEKHKDYYVFNGSKFWITNGSDADVIIVYARTEYDVKKPQHGITAFLIERGMEGFSSGKKLDKFGHRGSGTAELIFEDCKVPASQVLGEINKGIYVLFSGLDCERLLLCAGPVGVMQAACDVAFKYVHERTQFGQRVGEFQLMQGKLADMYVSLNSSRAYLYAVTRSYDAGHRSSKDCAAAILYCAEQCTQVCLQAIQCLGGSGYLNDFQVGRFLRDAKLYEIGGGTSEIRRLLIGRAINAEYK